MFCVHPIDAIAEPRRRELLTHITEAGEISVSQLAELVPVSRPAVSQHLKILREAGIVVERKSGRQRLYRVDPDGVRRARASIEVFLVNQLDDLESAARQLNTREPTTSESESDTHA